jgi:SnoaL-like domain
MATTRLRGNEKMTSERPQPTPEGGPEERYVATWKQAWSHGAGVTCLDEHASTIGGGHTLYIQPLFDAVTGEEGMRRLFGRVFALIPDMTVELDHWAIAEGLALIEFTLAGTVGGRPVRVRGVDRMQLEGDKLVARESYFDPLPLLIALISRPRAWPGALASMRLGTLPRLRPSRVPRSRAATAPRETQAS